MPPVTDLATSSVRRSPVISIMGDADADWRRRLEATLPTDVELVATTAATAWVALDAASTRYPNRDLVFVAAGTLLPPYWLPRLQAALNLPQVAAAQASISSAANGDDLARDDAEAYAHASRAAPDATTLDAPVLAVRAEAAMQLPRTADGFDLPGLPASWRVVTLPDLLVTAPAAAHGDAAMNHAPAGAVPAYPGLDGKPVLLHILHGWGGGAARWVGDYARADAAHHHLVLTAHGDFRHHRHGDAFELRWAGADPKLPSLRRFELAVPIADTAVSHAGYAAMLTEIRADFAVDAVLVSSLIGHSLDALATGLPTTLVIHDHYPLWPLLHADFGAVDAPFDAARMAADLAAAGADFEFATHGAAHWSRLRTAFVAAALEARANLIAPSHSALVAELRLAPEFAVLPRAIIAHGSASFADRPNWTLPSRPRLRLVVPGRVRKGKGSELLHAALDGLRRDAELVLLGAGAEGMDFFGARDVHVVLDYQREDLPRLIADFRPDAALIVPTVAETFSYTLSEMRALRVPVIATAVGALAERISDGVDGFLVAPDAASLVARIADLAADRAPLAVVRTNLAKLAPRDTNAMAADWNAALALPASLAPRYQPRLANNADAALRHARTRIEALQQTIVANAATIAAREREIARRGDWGWKLDRELAARHRELAAATARGEQLDADLIERTRWAQSLDTEVERLNADVTRLNVIAANRDEMLTSRSWRVTRPLRATTTRLRQLRSTLRFRLARILSLRGRLKGSLQRRGLIGTLRRIRREFEHRQSTTSPVRCPAPGDAFTPFALPASDTPRVSIVIPCYGKVEYTLACLRSLAEHAGATPFEVITIDDAAPDPGTDQLAQVTGLRMLRNAENLGFVGTCNHGAGVARGQYIVFLNNDTVVTAGWLEALVDTFTAHPGAGLVGARLVYPDGRLQEAGGIVFNDASGWNYGRFESPDDPRFNFLREADYCSGAAIMLPRALFESLGGFDTRYAPGYYEDTDLAFAVRAAGKKVYYQPRSTVVHFEGVSAGTDTTSGMKQYQVVNRAKFAAKWQTALATQPAPIDDAAKAHLAATHRARHRVLIVDASTPEPDQDSGSVRLVNIMHILGDMACQVSFLPDNLARFEKYTPALQAAGIEALYAPTVADLPAFYRARGAEFDLIMVSRHYILAHHLGLIRTWAPKARLAFDTVDLHYLRERRAAELDPRPERIKQAETTRAQELKLIRAADVTLVVSDVERTLLATEAPGAPVEILSNVHTIRGRHGDFATRKNLLFVGGFQHPPNIDAMTWFCADVLPLIRRELPDVQLDIVGSKMTAAIKALASDAVNVRGFVEELEPLLDAARISVAPLRYGAGVKGKVNSAMSSGLPVVATPMAVEGIHARDGEDVLIGANAEQFAAQVVRLYGDPALWQRLSDAGIANVRRQFSFDTARATLAELLTRD